MIETGYIAMLVLTIFSAIIYFFQSRDNTPAISFMTLPLFVGILFTITALLSFNIVVTNCVNQIDNQTQTPANENVTVYENTLTCEDTQVIEDDFGYGLSALALMFYVLFVLRVIQFVKEEWSR